MFEHQDFTKVAELTKKSRKKVQVWVNLFNERGLKALIPKITHGHPSSISEDQKEELKNGWLNGF
ncbi:MAG: helix-turn-helix domain-containing protein [Candidatus Lokiarchaeota archaeon]|nr:helix-turn-helix domain-containing protein [Candidatus Lokiarchaeota archaeon]